MFLFYRNCVCKWQYSSNYYSHSLYISLTFQGKAPALFESITNIKEIQTVWKTLIQTDICKFMYTASRFQIFTGKHWTIKCLRYVHILAKPTFQSLFYQARFSIRAVSRIIHIAISLYCSHLYLVNTACVTYSVHTLGRMVTRMN